MRVPIEPKPWPVDRALRVSVNSFGIGGANAHVSYDESRLAQISWSDTELFVSQAILDPPSELGVATGRPFVASGNRAKMLLLSANKQTSFKEHTTRIRKYIKRKPENASDLASTLALRREHLQHRTFILIGKDHQETISASQKALASLSGVTMVFSGQGAQWPQMGAELLSSDDAFREDIGVMDQVLRSLKHPPPWSLESELY